MRYSRFACITAALLFSATITQAQPPGGRGGRGPGRGGPQPPPRVGSVALLDDLPLNDLQQGLDARAALQAYDQAIRQQTLQARSELLQKMRTILTEAQFGQFKDQLEQIPVLPSLPPQPRGIGTSDLTDRLLGFDKNQDGRITKDELPERMLNLLTEGDTNQDGALDREEIRNLAARASVDDQPPGGGGRGRRGGPPFGRGFGRGGFPPGPPPDQQ